MRDRLIEIITEVENTDVFLHSGTYFTEMETKVLADHLLDNGVVVPPCKVGDRVWAIRDYKGHKHAQEGIVSEMFFTRDMELMIVVKSIARGLWGKTVFLSREEAERALEEVQNSV